jgi:hypothetical protein
MVKLKIYVITIPNNFLVYICYGGTSHISPNKNIKIMFSPQYIQNQTLMFCKGFPFIFYI